WLTGRMAGSARAVNTILPSDTLPSRRIDSRGDSSSSLRNSSVTGCPILVILHRPSLTAGAPGTAGTPRPSSRGVRPAPLPGRLALAVDDGHRARRVADDLRAHRAQGQGGEAASAARADDQQVGVLRRLQQLIGDHAADGADGHRLGLAVGELAQ